MRLEGPAYDTWRGLSSTEQSDAKAINSALQRVFGKSRFDTWAEMACDSPVPGEPLSVFGERLHLRAETALAGSTPVDTVCALFMLSALPAAQRDKVVLHLGEDITLNQVVKTAKLVQPVPLVRVAITPVKEVSSDMKSATAMPVAGRSKEIQVPTFKRMSSRSGLHCFACGREGHVW